MGDRQPSGAGWDGGEEKEGVRSAEKKRRKDGMTIEIGCQDSGNSGRGLRFRVN